MSFTGDEADLDAFWDATADLGLSDAAQGAGEDAEPAHIRVWGPGFALEDLVAAGLPDYASRLWLPMLSAERDPD